MAVVEFDIDVGDNVVTILKEPHLKQLVQYMDTAGLASSISALRAFVTEGILAGHTRLHDRGASK
jgi:hydroxymethylglutaryl-CoA reductase